MKDWIFETNKFSLTDEEAKHLLSFYTGAENRKKVYITTKMPFKAYSEIQKTQFCWLD